MHPTVKPVALVAEAIKDCSKRGEIVLDPFSGSGGTLIAAHKTGRCAPGRVRSCLLRPDRAALRAGRWQAGHPAATGQRFEIVAEERGFGLAPLICEEKLP
jgi:DNA methylase